MLHGKQTIKRIPQRGKYTFTAQITDDYKLAKDVVLPKLTIEITEAFRQRQPKNSQRQRLQRQNSQRQRQPEVKKPEMKTTEKRQK